MSWPIGIEDVSIRRLSTWGALPSAASNPFARYIITDLNNAEFYSDGVRWKPSGGRTLLQKSTVGYIMSGLSASSTVSLTSNVATVINGAPTAHNIPATTYDGCNIYFPGSASIPAGWYPSFVRTSATAYTFAYTRSDVGSESVNGGAAFTSEVTVDTTIPANLLGVSGEIRTKILWENNNSAGTKQARGIINSSQMWVQNQTTNLKYSALLGFANENSTAKQLATWTDFAGGTGGNAVADSRATVVTTADTTWKIGIQAQSVTDYIVLSAYTVELLH